MKLRPYQTEIIDKTIHSIQKNKKRQICVLPTGTGKTVVFCYLAETLNVPTLILAHRDELINQAAEKYRSINPNADIGIVKAERNETNHQITIASVQTVSRKNRLKELRDDYGLIITDECHHGVSPSYKRIFHRYGLLKESPDKEPMDVIKNNPTHFGVTATPLRSDSKGLASIYDHIVYQGMFADFVRNGWLCDLEFKGIKCELNLEGVKTTSLTGYGRDYQTSSLSAVVNTDEINRDVLAAWKKHASDRQTTLAFCIDREHAKDLYTLFVKNKVASAYIDGETPKEERHETLKRFSNGETKILFNIGVLTEGFDEPKIDCILLARPSKSPGLLTQIIGRSTRIAPNKTNSLILDVAHSHRVQKNAYGKVTHAGSILDLASLFYPPLPELEKDQKPKKQKSNESNPEGNGSGYSRPAQYFLGKEASEKSILEYLQKTNQREEMNRSTNLAKWVNDEATKGQQQLIKKAIPEFNKRLSKGEAALIIEQLVKENPELSSKRKKFPHENTCPECKSYKKLQYAFCYKCSQKNRETKHKTKEANCPKCGKWKQSIYEFCYQCAKGKTDPKKKDEKFNNKCPQCGEWKPKNGDCIKCHKLDKPVVQAELQLDFLDDIPF